MRLGTGFNIALTFLLLILGSFVANCQVEDRTGSSKVVFVHCFILSDDLYFENANTLKNELPFKIRDYIMIFFQQKRFEVISFKDSPVDCEADIQKNYHYKISGIITPSYSSRNFFEIDLTLFRTGNNAKLEMINNLAFHKQSNADLCTRCLGDTIKVVWEKEFTSK